MSAAHPVQSFVVGRLGPALLPVAALAVATAVAAGCASSPGHRASPSAEPNANAGLSITADPRGGESAGGDEVDRLAEQVRQYAQRLDPGHEGAPQPRDPQPAAPFPSNLADPPLVGGSSLTGPEGLAENPELGEASPGAKASPGISLRTPESTTPRLTDPEPVPPLTPQRQPAWGELAGVDAGNPEHKPDPTLEQQILARLGRDSSTLDLLDYHLLRLLEDEAPVLLAGEGAADLLSSEDQQILDTLTDGLRQFRDELRQEGVRRLTSAEKIAPIVEMSRQLRRDVGLTVPTVALCSEVRLFGNYDPLPLVFPIGQPRATILYVEVDNFVSRQGADGWWESRMTLSAVLYDDQGRPLYELPEATASDRARQRRRDFFLCTHFTLPAVARSGDYILKVTVRDDLAGRIAEESLRLRFTGN